MRSTGEHDGIGVMLRVEAPHFVAGALWRKSANGWECWHAAPILRWFIGKDTEWAKAYLGKKGWKYEWITEATCKK